MRKLVASHQEQEFLRFLIFLKITQLFEKRASEFKNHSEKLEKNLKLIFHEKKTVEHFVSTGSVLTQKKYCLGDPTSKIFFKFFLKFIKYKL